MFCLFCRTAVHIFLSNAFANRAVAPNTHRIYEDIRHCAKWAFKQSDINKEEYNENSREISLTALSAAVNQRLTDEAIYKCVHTSPVRKSIYFSLFVGGC